MPQATENQQILSIPHLLGKKKAGQGPASSTGRYHNLKRLSASEIQIGGSAANRKPNRSKSWQT
jgi:hypothetical protein